MKSESHLFFSISGDFKPETIPLIDDSEMEGTSGESLSNGVPSRGSLGNQFPERPNRGENLLEKPMSLLLR